MDTKTLIKNVDNCMRDIKITKSSFVKKRWNKSVQGLTLIESLFNKSQRFVTPDYDHSHIDNMTINLPYPVITFAYAHNISDGDGEQSHIAMIADVNHVKSYNLFTDLKLEDGYIVWLFDYMSPTWTPFPEGRWFPKTIRFTSPKTLAQKVISMGEFAEEAMVNILKNEEAVNFVNSHYEYLMLRVLNMCNAIDCENVEVETVRRSKLSVRNGSPKSAYEYKILKIKPHAEVVKSEPMGGTHASPRTHLRRGHTRRYANGKTVWIEATTVNPSPDGGIVVKDYAVQN